MPTDTVQIGSLVVSKVILDIIAPLLGTVIGGLISYLSITSAENWKLKQQKINMVQEQRREAIKIALQWIDPIHNAITRVTLQANPYHPSRAKLDGWPNLVVELQKYDVPRHLLIFLPDEAYEKSFAIIRLLDDLRFSVMDIRESSYTQEERTQFLKTAMDSLHNLQKISEDLSKLLQDEYKKTFS